MQLSYNPVAVIEDLRSLGRVALYRRNVWTEGIAERLEKIGVSITGFIEDGEVPAGPLVLSDPNWFDDLKHLLDGGKASRDLYVLPVDQGYVWGYWEGMERVFSTSDRVLPGDAVLAAFEQTEFKPSKIPAFGPQIQRFPDAPQAITQLLAGLSDGASRQLLKLLLFGSHEQIASYYAKNLIGKMQYFDRLHLAPGQTILNGGVFEGFELPFFIAHALGQAEVFCFDPEGFDNLSAYASNCVAQSQCCIEVRKALHSTCGDVFFLDSQGQFDGRSVNNPRIPEERRKSFEAVSIDDFVQQEELTKVDIIKLDIEGGEPDALDGAIKTLVDKRPQLALSVYHYPDHLWSMPLALMDLLDDYSFYLGHYAPACVETIFYAIPHEVERARR